MSPAFCGRRAAKSLPSALVATFVLALASAPALPANAAPAGAPSFARVAPPAAAAWRQTPQRHAAPTVQRQARQGSVQSPRVHQRPLGQAQLPATFRPSATWPQAEFRRPRRAVLGPSVILAPLAAGVFEPGMLDAPAASMSEEEEGARYVYREAPDPCEAPLLIRIAGSDAAPPPGVRVIHAQASPCGAPQVVRFAGPRVVEVTPSATSRTLRSGKRGKGESRGARPRRP